jgi:hypothetical protein
MTPEPAIRAAIARDFIESVRALNPILPARVLSQVPSETAEVLQGATRLGWIPMEHQTRINDQARKALGPHYREAWRRAMLRIFEEPILKPIVESSMRLFGSTPAALMRVTPRAYGLLIRDCGEFQFVEGTRPNAAGLALRGLPVGLAESGSFFEGMAGIFSAYFELSGTTGTVAIVDPQAAAGSASYALEWAAPAGGPRPAEV